MGGAEGRRPARAEGQALCGHQVQPDGASAALSIAVRTADNKIFVEAIDCRPTRAGSGWLLDFLSKAQFAAVAVDGASGQQLLADA